LANLASINKLANRSVTEIPQGGIAN